MKYRRKAARAALLGSIAAFATVHEQASAATEPAPAVSETMPDEIVVTAQKRVERLSDVPLSITAASGEQLVKQGVTDTTQLTKLVPGFTFQQSTFGSPVFAIRGIGFYDNSYLAGPAVTAYIDQVPLPLSAMTRGATLDLERVEALKGPQGTLFGQNSTGGAINFIAAKPTQSLKAGIDLGFGRFNEVISGAFISGPITDTLGIRVAARQESAEGWQRSQTRPGDTLGKKRFYNGRVLLAWKPTDRLAFEANISGWQDQSDSLASQYTGYAPSVAVVPRTQFIENALLASPTDANSPRDADWDPGIDYARNDKFYLMSLRGDWKMSDILSLTSITAFSRLSIDRPIDPDGSAFNNFRYDAQTGRAKTFSQEVRVSADLKTVRLMLGGTYQKQEGSESQFLSHEGTNNYQAFGPGLYFNASAYRNNQTPITKGVFGSADIDITSTITVQGSARYTEEKRRFVGCLADAGKSISFTPDGVVLPIRDVFAALSSAFSGSPTTIPPFGCISLNDQTAKPMEVDQTLDENNVAWRGGVNWKPTDDALLYANVSRGYKAGSFSILPAIFTSQFQPVTQESVLAYEVGFKLALARRRVQLTGALFYYDYSDKQLLGYADGGIFGSLPKLINIPKSRVQGAEIEATIRPIDGLRFSGGVTYVDSKVQSDPVAPNQALNPFLQVVSYIGEAFPNTPKWQAVGDIEYSVKTGDTVSVFAGVSGTYRSDSYAAFGRSPSFEIPSYALLDLRAGVESQDGTWRFQVYGRNVTNKLYITNTMHLVDGVSRTVGMPATYGASLAYRY